MPTENEPKIVFRFCRPSGAPAFTPSRAMTQALKLFSEADEMQKLIAGAHAQQRRVVVEVFHFREGHPFLIHTAATPKKRV